MAQRRYNIQRQTSRQSLRGRTILKQGYLKKVPQSGLVAAVKKWTERWFVFGVRMLEPFLEYYGHEDSVFTSTPINTISLATCRSVSHNILDTKNHYMFTITTSERSLNLLAKDRAEMGRWCEVITAKLGELGILTNVKSRSNLYEELPIQKMRVQRPLPPEPEDMTDSSEPPAPPVSHAENTASQHLYVNTSLPPTVPPPLPPRQASMRSSTSEDLIQLDASLRHQPSINSTHSSDFEDPFEVLACSRMENGTVQPENDLNIMQSSNTADLLDVFLQENTHSMNSNNNGISTNDHQELSPLCSNQVEITPDLSNLSGLVDDSSDSDNEEEYAPIWQQTSSTSPGRGTVANNTAVPDNCGSLTNTGNTLTHNANTQRIRENDYVENPTVANNHSRPNSYPTGHNVRLPSRQLSIVASSTNREPPISEDSILELNNSASPAQTSEIDVTFARKCADVDATNPLLSSPDSPPPYAAAVGSSSMSPHSSYPPHSPLSPSGAADGAPPPDYSLTPPPLQPPAGSVQMRRQNRHSLSCMQQLRSPMERGKSLKQSQVELLQQEMNNPGGVFIDLKRNDCFQHLAVIDMLGAVWVAGWTYAQKPFLHNAFHIGDQLISIGGHVINSSNDVYKILKHSPPHHKVGFNIRRVPHGRVLAILRSVEGESLGIQRLAGTAEIVSILPNSLAIEFGLTAKTKTMDGTSLCNWVLTEVNMRPLNLFFKDNEIEHRLNAVGKDISIMVQPADFIYMLKKKLKSLKNYKDYLVM